MEFIRFIYHVWNYNRILKISPQRWQALQEGRLRRLLAYANAHSPYLRKKWSGIPLETCRLQDLPIMTKAEMMEHFDDFVTDRRLKKDEIAAWIGDLSHVGQYYLDEFVPCHTSGSQGQVALVVQRRDAPFHLFAMQVARGHAMPKTWGTVFKKLFAGRSRWAMVLFRPCFIPSGAAFGYMPKPSSRLADILRLNLLDPFEENLRKLEAFKPHFITAYVHVLEQLAQVAKANKTTLVSEGNLQLAIAISEPLPPETQKFIEENLKVHVANHYAMGECPALSLGCPQGRGAHINTDMAILENVDDQYRPVPDGTPGSKVLLTNLLNDVQPIVRYEVDDVITISPDPCPCGNRLPLVASIAGRANDQFWLTLPDGENIEMSNFIFKDGFLNIMDMAEYQVTQIGKNRFQMMVQLVPGSKMTVQDVEAGIRRVAREEGVPVELDLVTELVPSIPRDPKSGKMRRFINRIGKPA
jgi:phenylacetate-CoA ligase